MRGMREVHRLQQSLDVTVNRLCALEAEADVKAEFARYLCVLVSAFLERALQEWAYDVGGRLGGTRFERFVQSGMVQYRSPNSEQVLQCVGAFDPAWKDELQSSYAAELEAANSVVNQRHNVAHGRQSNVTLSQFEEYYRFIKRLVRALETFGMGQSG